MLASCAFAAAFLSACNPQKPPPPPPPPEVLVLTVQPQSVPITQTWVTTLTGDINADIRAQVSGYLQSQNYVNGTYVAAGAVLFQIDPRPFQAALDQAKGSLAQAQAQLTASQLTADRAAQLYEKKVISLQQYDDQTQAYQASKASVQAAEAAVQQAQLNLVFTRITSPVDGLTSIATAQVGDLVGPSTGTLATVVKVDPIKVQFMVGEQDYVKFIQQYFKDPSKSPVGTQRDKNVELSLVLADGTAYPEKGRLTSVNNVVGIYTGSITLEGEFPNPGRLLRPGQFGLVTATVRTDKDATVVPQRAVINLQGLTLLAVVGEGNKVDLRQVTLGPTLGSDQIVTKGLNAGDSVIIEGVQKVRQGTVVNPKPYVETAQEKASDAIAAPATTPAATPAAKN
ncbi:MAG: efflux RND transporter periplasmic adaptor subunit [Terrimicrobiaceae bacterium]|nr:efflux RND transporter periplasmic adaptor subunit [Terrimicrobiaceae bacterium]